MWPDGSLVCDAPFTTSTVSLLFWADVLEGRESPPPVLLVSNVVGTVLTFSFYSLVHRCTTPLVPSGTPGSNDLYRFGHEDLS